MKVNMINEVRGEVREVIRFVGERCGWIVKIILSEMKRIEEFGQRSQVMRIVYLYYFGYFVERMKCKEKG